MAAIRERVKKDGVEHVFLVASHTHHGPVLELDDWPTAKEPYVRQLEKKLGDVIAAAVKELRPARVGVAAKDVPFNRNRHSQRADAPVDRELLVLRVEDMDGKAIAHAVNFAAHATMREAKDRRFSADYPGAWPRWWRRKRVSRACSCKERPAICHRIPRRAPAPMRSAEHWAARYWR